MGEVLVEPVDDEDESVSADDSSAVLLPVLVIRWLVYLVGKYAFTFR